eukprot:3217196-Karenia_brevis.AAC.1
MGEPYGDRSKVNRYNHWNNNYYGGKGRGRPYHNNYNPHQGGGGPPFRPPGNNDYNSGPFTKMSNTFNSTLGELSNLGNMCNVAQMFANNGNGPSAP